MEQALNNDQAITRDSLYGTAAESTYAGITSFARRRYSRDLRGVDVVVSGVPFDTATSNRPGARFGPRAIRAASVQQAWARHWPWACPMDPPRRSVDKSDSESWFAISPSRGVFDRHYRATIGIVAPATIDIL